MRKIVCNRAAAIYFDYKNAKPSHFHDVIVKEILNSNQGWPVNTGGGNSQW